MKKKQSLLFLLFIFVTIVVLALCLIFGLKADKDDENNGNKNLSTGSQSGTYVTFELANESAIYMDLNSSVEILDSFFVVSNISLNALQCEVCSYYNSDVSGLKYENRKITATVADSYKLKFYLTVGSEIVSHDVIIVVEDNPKIIQKATTVNIDKEYDVNDLFGIDEQITNFSLASSEYFTMSNKTFKTLKTGETGIDAYYINNGVKHSYKFNIKILPKADYTIQAEDITTSITKGYCYLEYKILDKNLVNNGNQQIIVEIQNENVVEKIDVTAPIITFKINGVGTTSITIKLKSNNEIYKTVQVTVT